MDQTRLLLVLRHAKSAWPEGVDDHERPLGPRGLKDAPKAGRWLKEHGYLPERVRCSTARRARETWQLVSGEFEQQPPVEYDDALYGGDYLEIARRTPDDVTRLAIVGHEPSVSEVTFQLAGRTAIDAFPTGAVAVFEVTESWARLDRAQLTAFFRPRDLPGN
ncbi:histidine phosphatase family protein [Amycolatopsis sp. WQ 127309]|uniref:SixA phosphatase family protein n=1 Tax=Amycolatopsis sp. WQ 127309 TaxID=2932773 RepID=UPI001FF123A4|nr:histidine phosphatase family protein [Amycolatopsis sp. WQ 127309]UOZ09329.1 histidine phosphatase family protein [Amycolatopsis sp. WQ 127309]